MRSSRTITTSIGTAGRKKPLSAIAVRCTKSPTRSYAPQQLGHKVCRQTNFAVTSAPMTLQQTLIQHRMVGGGETTPRIWAAAAWNAQLALLPLADGIGYDAFVPTRDRSPPVLDRHPQALMHSKIDRMPR